MHMDDFGVVACEAVVESVNPMEDGRNDVILNQTCFYARGGGQDWDTGSIDDFAVEEVRLDEHGVVHHIGHGAIKSGQAVQCSVDETRRRINTRLHSAGHVVDMANSTINPDWIPGRGAHYPHMSFVEYSKAAIDETTQTAIQHAVNAILSQDITNTMRYVTHDELTQLCRHVPDSLPANKPIRVVCYGDFGVPCGGTHVQKLSDIGKVVITKVKSKKGITKISYQVEGVSPTTA